MPPEKRIYETKRYIEEFGHKVYNIWNIKKRGTKVQLNKFYVARKEKLKPEKNNKDIYQTTHVFSYTVKFEPQNSKREIP